MIRVTQKRGPLDLRTRIAFHEAGHAVLSAAINDGPHHVSIRTKHGTLGRSAQKMFARPTSLVQVYLAGFAAEHAATGRRPRAYAIETGLAILAHTDPQLVDTFEGVEVSDGYGAIYQLLRAGVRPVEEELRREVDKFYEVTRQSVAAVWPSVKALAQALLGHEEMDRDAIDGVIGGENIYGPVFAVQRVHGLFGSADGRAERRRVEAAMMPAKKTKSARHPRSSKTSAPADGYVLTLLSKLRRDAKLAPLVAAYEKDAAMPGRKFGKNGLKTRDGKLFALFTQGTLVVKLPKERVAALVAEGIGKPFDPGHGRLMKQWLTVTSSKAPRAALALEAFEFVAGTRDR